MSEFLGILSADGDRRRVRFERRYDVSVDELWNALVDPDQLRGWLAETVLEPRVGGRFEIRFGDAPGERAWGVVRELEPQRVLELDWEYEGEPPSVVRFELRPEEEGTTLVLDHRLLADAAAAGYAAGWHAHLDALADRLERRRPRAWDGRFRELLPEYREQAEAISGR